MRYAAAMRALMVAVGFLTLVAGGRGAEAAPANEQADALAARVLDALSRPVGLAHLPRCQDAGQALALARAGKWTYVHGQSADPAAVARVRRAVDDAGLLNRRISIDQGDLQRLLLAKQSDLRAAAHKAMPDLSTAEILAKDGTYKEGMSIPPDEIVRPLSELPGRWRKPIAYGWSAVATALGPDAAVVCLVHHSGKARLTAYDRADGGELWALELPDAPVHNGLAVAADGRIVVALRDGRVVCAANRDRAPK